MQSERIAQKIKQRLVRVPGFDRYRRPVELKFMGSHMPIVVGETSDRNGMEGPLWQGGLAFVELRQEYVRADY